MHFGLQISARPDYADAYRTEHGEVRDRRFYSAEFSWHTDVEILCLMKRVLMVMNQKRLKR